MMVVLGINIFEPKEEKVYPFRMSVEIEGYFKSNFEAEEQGIEQYEKNAVAILFPYVRAHVSTFTANANVTPLILPTVNVNKLLDRKKQQ
ncbi:MAG: protein-export chaperone SecB [Firmicutes bacterium]|nr:protein-export chaperone SecB [Bacillota bacterium]